MKSDLDILIEHVELELDAIEVSISECTADWDFTRARAFREAYDFTRNKLETLKSVKNPNRTVGVYRRLRIERLEQQLRDAKRKIEDLDENIDKKLDPNFISRLENQLNQLKREQKKLEAPNAGNRFDSDIILTLLGDLEIGKITRLQFEIVDEIHLRIEAYKGVAKFEIWSEDKGVIEAYLAKHSISLLKKLRYDTNTYTKEISNFAEIDKHVILQELSRLYFEVFGVYGRDILIIVG